MYKKFLKRLIDFCIALIASPFVCVVVLIMAPIIYFNDPGPIFYNAKRRGKNGKVFKMYKLRSMYVNAPDIRNDDGSTFNSSEDNRVTKVGKFMRKTSIDELPQFFNVLFGDMSIIGPRPILATQPYEKLSDLAKERLKIRPGITGYAQAYYRNAIGEEEKFKVDCYYGEHISFVLDVKILIKTFATVIKRDNIYVSEQQK